MSALHAVASEPMTAAITCLVADDHPAVVQAVSEVLIAGGIDVVSQSRDGEEALAAIQKMQPRVALLDLRMPRLSGIEVARRCARSTPETCLLYTSDAADDLLCVD